MRIGELEEKRACVAPSLGIQCARRSCFHGWCPGVARILRPGLENLTSDSASASKARQFYVAVARVCRALPSSLAAPIGEPLSTPYRSEVLDVYFFLQILSSERDVGVRKLPQPRPSAAA